MDGNLKLSDGKQLVCECGGTAFLEAHMFYRFSKLLTGETKDTVMPVPTFVCAKCGKVPDEFLPKDSNGLVS